MVQIYTDGGCACSNGVGAWSLVAVRDGNVVFTDSSAREDTTNNEMELTAILEAFRYARSNKFEDVTVLSDSQYSVNAVNIWYKHWRMTCTLCGKKHIKLIERIIAAKGSARLVWIKGHSDNQFNNLADRLANDAIHSLVLKCRQNL